MAVRFFKVDSPLLLKVKRFLDRLEGPPNGMILAVSGGPDSVALLRALLEVRPRHAPFSLVIAHLNHQLRGQESDADEEFVRGLVTSFDHHGCLHLRIDRIDMAELARKENGNLEEVARRERYTWLTRVALDSGVHLVATGHTADDLAETVLHHLLRGTGLKGLRGIAPHLELTKRVQLIRPLLHVTRAEVLAYLEARNQPNRQDSSNLDLRFTRNRIRRDLLPRLMEDYNPAIVEILCRLAKQTEEFYEDVQARAQNLMAAAEKPRAGMILVLDRHTLMTAPRYLVREVFRLLWEREKWPVGKMGFEDWERLAAVVWGETHGADLPGRVRVHGQENVVQIQQVS